MTSTEKFSILRKRSEITEAVRSFFLEKGFLQVDTPLLAPHVIPEAHIEIFKTEQVSMCRPPQNLYLLPSPELWMKKLIAKGSGSIFQICKCFRNNEQEGSQHSNEFTMLEYYADNADYLYSLALTEELFKSIFLKFNTKYAKMPINIMTIQSAFLKTTGIDIENYPDFPSLKEAAIKAGFEISDSYTTWEEVREKIEPVMHIIDLAKEAMKSVGVTPIIKPIRGGTDGARLSFEGLPCPNIFAGGENFHSRYEYLPVLSMEKAMEVILQIVQSAK